MQAMKCPKPRLCKCRAASVMACNIQLHNSTRPPLGNKSVQAMLLITNRHEMGKNDTRGKWYM